MIKVWRDINLDYLPNSSNSPQQLFHVVFCSMGCRLGFSKGCRKIIEESQSLGSSKAKSKYAHNNEKE